MVHISSSSSCSSQKEILSSGAGGDADQYCFISPPQTQQLPNWMKYPIKRRRQQILLVPRSFLFLDINKNREFY